jgi:membrane-associated protease RseP (regulator of RpoE activity)
MTRYESRGVWDALLLTAAASLAVVFSQAQQSAFAAEKNQEEIVEEGRIVTIDPDSDPLGKAAPVVVEEPATEPSYWIGLAGGPINDPVLRTHLQLADDVGVVVMQVVPDSPAAKAGLKQHDVLIAVNGEALAEMPALQKVVAGSEGKPIELKVIRLAKEMTLSITPEQRPADFSEQASALGAGGVPPQFDEQRLRQFADADRQFNEALKQLRGGVRVFGPGMTLGDFGQRINLSQLPGGVSVAITREDDEPAKIVVKRGDQSWEIVGDDKEALAKLPDDVRPFVEQMLDQQAPGAAVGAQSFNFRFPAFDEEAVRRHAEAASQHAEQAAQRANEQVLERMKRLEKSLLDLEKRLQKEFPAPRVEEKDAPADPSTT